MTQAQHARTRTGRRAGFLGSLLGSLVAGLLATALASPALADVETSGAARQSREDAWWTGPLLASGAATLPKGYALVEPYLYDIRTDARFDGSWKRHDAAADQFIGSRTYLLYGVTDDFTAGAIPVFGYQKPRHGRSSSGVGVGDLTIQGQYELRRWHEGSWLPTVGLVVGESLPIGRFDKLGDRPEDGFGTGAYATNVALNSQTYFWTPNGRILRTRLNLSYTRSAKASPRDVSVYGTPQGFRGHARPGDAFNADLAFEYSLTQRWVLASDFAWEHDASTRVRGEVGARPYRADSGSSDTFFVAPAVEYNWSPAVGVIAGARIAVAGRNSTASTAPVVALNYVF